MINRPRILNAQLPSHEPSLASPRLWAQTKHYILINCVAPLLLARRQQPQTCHRRPSASPSWGKSTVSLGKAGGAGVLEAGNGQALRDLSGDISRRRSRDTTSPRRCERSFFSNVSDVLRLSRNESADRVHILLAFGVELPGNLVRQWGDVGDSAAGDLLAELGKPQFGALADGRRSGKARLLGGLLELVQEVQRQGQRIIHAFHGGNIHWRAFKSNPFCPELTRLRFCMQSRAGDFVSIVRHLFAGNNPERANAAQAPAPLGANLRFDPFPVD